MFQSETITNKINNKNEETNFAKGIPTLIGAALINFLVGAIYSLCTLSVYEISYIKGIGGSISIEHLTFYYPIEVFFQCISAFISGIIYKHIGLHKTNFIGVSILSLGYFIMYLSTNIFMDMSAMILGGIGTGIILYPSTTNAYEWFKEHNGIIVGIMETMISLGSFFFAFLGEKIINNKEIPSNDEDNLYDISIGKRIKKYLIVQISSLISVFFLSLILMHEKVKKDEINLTNKTNEIKIINSVINYLDNEKEDLEIGIKEKENNIGIKNKIVNIPSKRINDETTPIKIVDSPERLIKYILNKSNFGHKINNENKNKDNLLKKTLLSALKSNRLRLFSIIVILQAPVSNMAFTLYREIGEYKKIDVKYLQLVGSLYFIFECLSSFVFGILCDYIKLKYLLLFINTVGTFVGFTYCSTLQNGLIFFLVQNFLSFSAGGYYPVKDCYLMKVFGKDIYIELSAFVSFLVSIAINLLTPITYFIMSGLENKELAYWILFVSFGVINLVGTILNFCLSETPIDKSELVFEEENEEKKNEEKEKEKEEEKDQNEV